MQLFSGFLLTNAETKSQTPPPSPPTPVLKVRFIAAEPLLSPPCHKVQFALIG